MYADHKLSITYTLIFLPESGAHDENYAESFVKDSLRKMVMDEPYGPLPDGQFYRKMNNTFLTILFQLSS